MLLEDFCRTVIRSQLVAKPDLLGWLQTFREQGGNDSKHFARFLIRSDVLTRFQAERLLAGRCDGFFRCGCKILDRLGQGGMGTVYLCEQTRLGRRIALKVIKGGPQADAQHLARFMREARAAADLKHPNIAQIYDLREDEQGRACILMEYVEGENLSQILRQRGLFSEREAVDVVRQVAEGLQHAHERGIVHRDIKPANLMLEGRVIKILDLGLARRAQDDLTLTTEGVTMGSPAYMSPEQFRNAQSADIRSDLYSLGCTWYQLRTGKLPFESDTPLGLAIAHQQSPRPALDPNQFPHAAVLRKLLDPDPDQRFQTPRDLLFALNNDSPHPALVATTSLASITPSDTSDSQPSAPATALTNSLRTQHSSDSLIRSPHDSFFTSVIFILPIVGALVLGGVAVGVRLLHNRAPSQRTVVVHVNDPATDTGQKQLDGSEPKEPARNVPQQQGQNAANSSSNVNREPIASEQARQPSHPSQIQPEDGESGRQPADISQRPESTAPAATTAPDEQAADMVAESQVQSATRAAREILVADSAALATALGSAVDGDSILLDNAGPFELDPTTLHADVEIRSTASPPALVCCTFEEDATAEAVLRLEQCQLRVEGVAWLIDARQLRSGAERYWFDVVAGRVRCSDCSLTVLRGNSETFAPVTVLRVRDQSADADKPSATQDSLVSDVHFERCFVRGAHSFALINSRHVGVVLDTCIVSLLGHFAHAFHSAPHEYQDQEWKLEVVGSIVEANHALIAVDVRPHDMSTVPMQLIWRHNSIVPSSGLPRDLAQVVWESPTSTERLSVALHWTGAGNSMPPQMAGLRSRNASEKMVSVVNGPDDWQKLALGQEVDAEPLPRDTPRRRPPHERTLSDYRAVRPTQMDFSRMPAVPRRFPQY